MTIDLPAPWALRYVRSEVICNPELHTPFSDERGCGCHEIAWSRFLTELDVRLAALGEHAWLLHTPEDPTAPESFEETHVIASLEAFALSRRRLAGYVDPDGPEVLVTFDRSRLRWASGSDWLEVEPVRSGRGELYQLLELLCHDDIIDVSLEMPDALYEVACAYAQRLTSTHDYVGPDEFPDERFSGVPADLTLTPAEHEVALSLARGEWEGDLADLLTAAQSCLAAV